jgi:hypothetical protein
MQTLRIPFPDLQRKRKQLGISFRGTKTEANSRNSLPNPSEEEKTPRNSVLWYENRSKISEFRSEPFRGIETTQNKTQQWQSLTVFKLRVPVEAVRIGFHHPG